MENNQLNSPDSLHKLGKDINLNELNLKFDLKSIGIEDIKTEAVKYSQAYDEPEAKKTNPFPVEVFPLAVQQIIKATNESLNFPTDFFGASILYAVSLAVGNTYRVEILNGWQESAVLFITNVGRPGTNKSHPLSFALRPIFERQEKNFTSYEKKKKEYDHAVKLSKEERQQQGIDEPVKPFWVKFTVSDFTPEALAEVHKFNKRGIGVYVDELAGWFKNFNRYHKGAEEQIWLSIWSGEQINIDRKTSEPVFIPLPFISVAGNIQPGILTELAKDNRAQNGFIDRILFAFPDELKKPYWSKTGIQPGFIDNWENIISNILSLKIKLNDNLNPEPEVLKFTPEAFNKLTKWQIRNTDLCRQAENEALEGIYSKFERYAGRLALILEILQWACKENEQSIQQVGIEAVDGALQLVEYFRVTAVKVHSIISNFNPLDKLPTDKLKFYEALPETFTTEEGLKIAALHSFPERTFKRFLNEKELFNRIRQGEYEKRF